MRDIKLDYDTLTVTLPLPKDDFQQALLALTLQAKNLYNTGVFFVRQVLAAYKYDRETKTSHLKPNLHKNQLEIIEHINIIAERVNQKRLATIDRKREKKPDTELKLISLLGNVVNNPARTVLDTTILDNALRVWTNEHGHCVYASLPATMAQNVLARVGEAFTSYFLATKRYNTNPKNMTGRPQMPGYLFVTERFVLDIDLAHTTKGKLPSIKGKIVPEDYLETGFLSPEVLACFSAVDVGQMISIACKKRKWTHFVPKALRIVPINAGTKVRIEAIVRVQNAYPQESFLARIVRDFGPKLSLLKTPNKREEWLVDYLKDTPFADLPRIAGIDLGVNNLATLAFSTGNKACVFSGGRFDKVIAWHNERLDSYVSRNTTPRARELQGKKKALEEKGEQLEQTEFRELKKLLKAIYNTPEYRKLREARENWVKDFLHKMSRGIVERCVNRNIDVIVIGRNIGWKQESNLSTDDNRRFCQIAHARLINLIRYKAESFGIAVVTTEESYTSKTSFVTNEAMEVYNKARKETLKSQATPRPTKDGYRRSDDRNWFVNKQKKNERWHIVHADVNGAFNIIRKLFIYFTYTIEVTLKFNIYRLSPRVGIHQISV